MKSEGNLISEKTAWFHVRSNTESIRELRSGIFKTEELKPFI